MYTLFTDIIGGTAIVAHNNPLYDILFHSEGWKPYMSGSYEELELVQTDIEDTISCHAPC